MNNFDSVERMYLDFGLSSSLVQGPILITDEAAVFRLNAMLEELQELEEGYKEKDLPKIADSLVDLVVFALGTATLHNLPWEDLFAEVMRANTNKIPQFTDKKKRNGIGSIDLIKPEDWRPPDIEGVLKKWGWVDLDAARLEDEINLR